MPDRCSQDGSEPREDPLADPSWRQAGGRRPADDGTTRSTARRREPAGPSPRLAASAGEAPANGRDDPGGPASTTAEVRLASILDTAPDGVVVIDERGTILVYNRACERMFGYAAPEALGRNVAMLMPLEHAERHDSYLAAFKRGHRRMIGIGREVSGRRKNGTVFPLDLSVGEANTPEGCQFIGIMRDLSVRKENQRRLAEAQAELIRLARVSALDEMGLALAHELNQPLTAIILYVQAAHREMQRAQQSAGQSAGEAAAADDRAQAALEKARREAQRAGAIIQRVRDLGQKRAPERRTIDLNAVIEEAIELTLIGQDRTVRLAKDFRKDLPAVRADPVQVQQVVMNLLRNAFEAVRFRKDPQVVVSTRAEERHAVFVVADNGPGIPADLVPGLFRTFTSGKCSGLGLGLAISRSIVQSHQGELHVDPGGQGQGARFIVRLPLMGPVELADARPDGPVMADAKV